MSPAETGWGRVGAALDAAELVPPVDDGGGPGGGGWAPDGVQDKVPVTCLGHLGDVYFYLDASGQFRELKAKDHGRLALLSLLGVHADRVRQLWPRYGKNGDVVGWHPEEMADQLMRNCARAGLFDGLKRVRGRGAWRGDDGELVLHCGDQVVVSPAAGGGLEKIAPGAIGRHVYPAYAPAPRPYGALVLGGEKGPAAELLRVLQRWPWRRPDLDPYLLLGWIVVAPFGGALPWRPLAWLTGDRGTGKSTLQAWLGDLIGADGLVQTGDATAAGIWQSLGPATLPVAIDELEAEDDGRRAAAVLKLARGAASGTLVLRGGADHASSTFVAQSCFLFSSILVPPLLPADLSRIAVLELGRLAGADPPRRDRAAVAELGAKLRRRMLDAWPRFAGVLEGYRAALAARGHDGRGCDLFGTLLAAAEVALWDHEQDGDSLDAWAEKLATSAVARDEDSDHQHCLQYLLSTTIDPFRSGARRTVGSWVMQAAGIPTDDGPPPSDFGKLAPEAREDAVKALAGIGLKLVTRGGVRVLLVANRHRALGELFEDSHWRGRSGADGVWRQSLARLPGAADEASPQRFGGVQSRCVAVPLSVAQGAAAGPGTAAEGSTSPGG